MADMTYSEWDQKRRELYPDAQHDHWDTWDGSDHPAGWNPHNGRCYVIETDDQAN